MDTKYYSNNNISSLSIKESKRLDIPKFLKSGKDLSTTNKGKNNIGETSNNSNKRLGINALYKSSTNNMRTKKEESKTTGKNNHATTDLILQEPQKSIMSSK